MWIYVWAFNLSPLNNTSVFLAIPWCVYYYRSVMQLEIGMIKFLGAPLLFSFVLAFIWSWRQLFKTCEELCWNIDEDCIESVDFFWWDDHFYFINPTDPWVWKIFLYLICFFSVLKFFYTSFSVSYYLSLLWKILFSWSLSCFVCQVYVEGLQSLLI